MESAGRLIATNPRPPLRRSRCSLPSGLWQARRDLSSSSGGTRPQPQRTERVVVGKGGHAETHSRSSATMDGAPPSHRQGSAVGAYLRDVIAVRSEELQI